MPANPFYCDYEGDHVPVLRTATKQLPSAKPQNPCEDRGRAVAILFGREGHLALSQLKARPLGSDEAVLTLRVLSVQSFLLSIPYTIIGSCALGSRDFARTEERGVHDLLGR